MALYTLKTYIYICIFVCDAYRRHRREKLRFLDHFASKCAFLEIKLGFIVFFDRAVGEKILTIYYIVY